MTTSRVAIIETAIIIIIGSLKRNLNKEIIKHEVFNKFRNPVKSAIGLTLWQNVVNDGKQVNGNGGRI